MAVRNDRGGFAGGIDIENGTRVAAISGDHPIIGSITRDAWRNVSLMLDYATQTLSGIDGSVIASSLP
jgi:hypothetical protein